jgi:hypothetical protein
MRCKISQFESDIKKNDGKKYFHGVLLTILAMVGRGSAAAYGEEATQWETKQKNFVFCLDFHSPCTNFGLRPRLGGGSGNQTKKLRILFGFPLALH